MGKFLIKKTPTGYNFHLKAGNGETIGTSEVYTTLAACRNGVESVMKNAVKANVEDQTVENFEVCKHPKFEIYTDKAGDFRFRLKATNGEPILASEGIHQKQALKTALKVLLKTLPMQQLLKKLNNIFCSPSEIQRGFVFAKFSLIQIVKFILKKHTSYTYLLHIFGQ